jgi:hypothetical protein
MFIVDVSVSHIIARPVLCTSTDCQAYLQMQGRTFQKSILPELTFPALSERAKSCRDMQHTHTNRPTEAE